MGRTKQQVKLHVLNKKYDATPTPSKKKTPCPVPSATSSNVKPKNKSNIKKKARLYRDIAKHAGYIKSALFGYSGRDIMRSLITEKDIKRMLKFCPTDNPHAVDMHAELQNVSFPPSALKTAALYVESILRDLMNDSVTRTVESGHMRVSPASMHRAIRKYGPYLDFGVGKEANQHTVRDMIRNAIIPDEIGMMSQDDDTLKVDQERHIEAKREERKKQMRKEQHLATKAKAQEARDATA